MQIARAKIIRPPMAMVMLEGSRFEKGDIAACAMYTVTQYTISSSNKKEISLREFAVSGQEANPGERRRSPVFACDDDRIYPAIASPCSPHLDAEHITAAAPF